MKTVIMSWQSRGHSVALLDQNNGYLEVRAQQKDLPPRCAGIYEKSQLIEALNKYHKQKDAMSLVSGCAA